MKKPETITRHRRIIADYCKLVCDHVDRDNALEKISVKNGLKRSTVKRIVSENTKYYKEKMREFNKCKIKIEWNEKLS